MDKEVKQLLFQIMKYYRWTESTGDIVWNIVSLDFPLSEDFIREFKNQLNWTLLSCNTDFFSSDNFIKEFKDKFDLDMMLFNGKISQKLYDELRGKEIT